MSEDQDDKKSGTVCGVFAQGAAGSACGDSIGTQPAGISPTNASPIDPYSQYWPDPIGPEAETLEAYNRYLGELAQVTEVAVRAVHAAMRDGWDHGYRGEWLKMSGREHATHAGDHTAALELDAICAGSVSAADVEHAITRLAMLIIRSTRKGDRLCI